MGQFDKNRYDDDYKRKHYDRFNLILPKGTKAILQNIASNQNTTINGLLNTMIQDLIAKNPNFQQSKTPDE